MEDVREDIFENKLMSVPRQALHVAEKKSGHTSWDASILFWAWFVLEILGWLVVWNMNFIFPYIGNVIIPIDFDIFRRGGPTTNQS